jgi:transmembrane protein 33
LAGLRFLLGVFTFNTPNLKHWYTLAYLGAIISYGVVVYKSFGVPQLNKAYLQRAAFDENVQYLLLAVYWWFNKPIFVTLIPYVTFSLFHVLTFVRTTVIPMVFPHSSTTPSRSSSAEGSSSSSNASGTAAAGANSPPPAKAAKFIQTWVKANYDPAMRFVAYSEVAIFARVLFGAVLFKNSLLAPLFYAHFLRLRFYMSSFTRGAFQHVGSVLDGYTQHPSCPPAVRRGYLMLTDLISRYASTVLSVQNQGAAAGGANGAAAPQAGQRRQ